MVITLITKCLLCPTEMLKNALILYAIHLHRNVASAPELSSNRLTKAENGDIQTLTLRLCVQWLGTTDPSLVLTTQRIG